MAPTDNPYFYMRSGAQQAYSDASVFNNNVNYRTILNSDVKVLTLTSLKSLTIGGGNAGNLVISSPIWPSTIIGNSMLTMLSSQWQTTNTNRYTVGFNSVPLINGKNFPPALPEPLATVSVPGYGTIDEQLSQCFGAMPVLTTQFAPFTFSGIMGIGEVNTNDIGAPTYLVWFAYFPAIKTGFGGMFPGFTGISASNQTSLLVPTCAWMPDYVAQRNLFISASSLGGTPGYVGYYFNLAPGSMGITEGPFNLSTDNAALNAILTSGSGRLVPTARGFLLITTGGDYFINPAFTEYWSINYVAGAAGITLPPVGIESNQGSFGARGTVKTIDQSGIFWYTGINAYNSGTGKTTPLFSFGFNLPFNPPVLPSVPPLKIPCWPPCSGMDFPFDNASFGN
jgi:hypothetical protein